MQFENLHTSAAKEPHLLAAILTVASRDEKVQSCLDLPYDPEINVLHVVGVVAGPRSLFDLHA